MRNKDIKLEINYYNFFKVNNEGWDEESLKPFWERKQNKLPRLNKVDLTKWLEEQSNMRMSLEVEDINTLQNNEIEKIIFNSTL